MRRAVHKSENPHLNGQIKTKTRPRYISGQKFYFYFINFIFILYFFISLFLYLRQLKIDFPIQYLYIFNHIQHESVTCFLVIAMTNLTPILTCTEVQLEIVKDFKMLESFIQLFHKKSDAAKIGFALCQTKECMRQVRAFSGVYRHSISYTERDGSTVLFFHVCAHGNPMQQHLLLEMLWSATKAKVVHSAMPHHDSPVIEALFSCVCSGEDANYYFDILDHFVSFFPMSVVVTPISTKRYIGGVEFTYREHLKAAISRIDKMHIEMNGDAAPYGNMPIRSFMSGGYYVGCFN